MPTISTSSWIGSRASQSASVKWLAADWVATASPRKATLLSKNSRTRTPLSDRRLVTAVRDAKSTMSHNRPGSVIIGRLILEPEDFHDGAHPHVASAVSGHGRGVDRDHCSRPQALSEPSRRSPRHHPRHPVRRRLARFRRDLGARRPSRAHAGRGRDIRQFQDHPPTIVGESMTGRFRTAPSDQRSVSFVWSGDTAGQGWGIDEARGGMRTYATMLRNRPDFFIHNGDNIYADGPILAEQKMPNGEIWKNVVIEEKTKPAETLAEFRANYKYNLLDRNVLAFNAEVPIFSQWDDHEVTNNWWPGELLTRAEHQRKKYVEKNALILAARASRAFHEYMPLRFTQTEPGRVYRKISYGPLLDVFMLDMRSY